MNPVRHALGFETIKELLGKRFRGEAYIHINGLGPSIQPFQMLLQEGNAAAMDAHPFPNAIAKQIAALKD